MDYDYSTNTSMDNDIEPIYSPTFNMVDYTFIVMTTMGFIADILIIYAIGRFARMQTIRNILILNWALADCLFQLLNEYKLTLISYINRTPIFNTLHCIYKESEFIYMSAGMTFVLALAMNLVYRRINKFNLKYVVFTMWGFYFGLHFLHISLCICEIRFSFHMQLWMGIFFAILSSHIYKNCAYIIRRFQGKDRKTKLRYILTTVYGFTYLLIVALLFFQNLLHAHLREPILFIIGIILCYSNAWINVFILNKYDKNFHIYFSYMLRRCTFEQANSSISYENDEDGVGDEQNMQMMTPLEGNEIIIN